MPDLIMFSTNDHDTHQKVVLIKRNNPCHSPMAQRWWETMLQNKENKWYHGALVLKDDDDAQLLLERLTPERITILWV